MLFRSGAPDEHNGLAVPDDFGDRAPAALDLWRDDVLAVEQEPMGWGTRPDDIRPWMPEHGRLDVLDGVGHFVHIEQPERMAATVLDFLEHGR